MRLSKIKLIFQKEILDTLRDRRTLITMLFIPLLLYPGIMMLISSVAAKQQEKMARKTVQLAVINVSKDSDLAHKILADPKVNLVDSKNPLEDLTEGKLHFVLRAQSDLETAMEENKTAEIQLYYDRANEDSTSNLDLVLGILESYEKEIIQSRLRKISVQEEYVDPITLKETNVASKQKMGGFFIGRILPMLMVFMVLVGSIYPAIDMTAGEKERGTLETILTSPATRTEIVVGKFLTVSLIALLTGILNMGSMMATFAYGLFQGAAAEAIQVKIPYSYLLIILICLIPLAVFFSGVMMAISSFARSFKEAQNFITPFYLVATMPAMISSIPGIRLEGVWLTIPIANVTLLFKDMLLGTLNWNSILIVFFCSAFLGSMALFFAIRLFGREEVLFGETSSFGLSIKRGNISPKPIPDSSESIFFAMISLCLVIYVAIPLQAKDLVSGLIFTELIIFLALPVAFAIYLKLDLKRTFRLRGPSSRSLLGTFLMFAGVALTITTIFHLQNRIFPIPKELEDLMEKIMMQIYTRPFWQVFLLLAVLPAFCEETTFRGVILSGMLSRKKTLSALLITATLFGIFHLSLHRFLVVFLIGLAASFLVWKSGSLLTGILLHMFCNGYTTFSVLYPKYDFIGFASMKPNPLLFAAGCVLIGFSIAVMQKNEVRE